MRVVGELIAHNFKYKDQKRLFHDILRKVKCVERIRWTSDNTTVTEVSVTENSPSDIGFFSLKEQLRLTSAIHHAKFLFC